MKRYIILAGAAALAALALATAYFYVPGGARPVFDEGVIRVRLNEDGSMELDWPEAGTAPEDIPEDAPAEDAPEDAPAEEPPVLYHVDIKSGDSRYRQTQSSPGLLLEGVTLPLEIRIRAAAEGKNLLGLSRSLTSRTLAARADAAELSAPQASGTPGPGSLSLTWTLAGAAPDLYEVYANGDSRPAASSSSKSLELKVGRSGDLPLPGYGEPLRLSVRAGVRGEGYVLLGPASNLITVERQDLLGDELNLSFQETEPRVFTLEWDETRGEYYELQEWDGEGWTLLETLEPAERFVYELGRLGSGSYHRFQVSARDGGGLRSSEEVEFFASVDPLYATVWPIIDQPCYERPDPDSPSLGKIPGGAALCVLKEEGDWFLVRYKDQYVYVDSRFCMINLPEYTGDHCSYDITNSYQSLFKVHESPIALITDQVVSGFEHMREADGSFLVPYLYPCSKKLLSAALAAEADGYRLKIYEAFRPNQATRFLYDTTAAQLDWAALVYEEEETGESGEFGESGESGPRAVDPVTGWVVDLADGLLTDPETQEKLSREDLREREEQSEEQSDEQPDEQSGEPSPEDEQPEPPDPSQPFIFLPPEEDESPPESQEESPEEPQEEDREESPEEQESQEEPSEESPEEGQEESEEEPEYDTYFQLMTNGGRFSLGSFLARVTSAHNRGIALDLTLEEIATGEELEMQSAIHDLSWYSAAYLNNENAKLLEGYMTGAGMRGLTSEWWHFQDDETREAIGLTGYLYQGVDMSGWTRDERGWRYREADGSIRKGASVTVDGKRYVLDQDGYAQE